MTPAAGVLILVAAVLLVAGAAGTGLALVYASIVLSLVAAGLLLARALRRRPGRTAARPAAAPVGPAPAADGDPAATPPRPAAAAPLVAPAPPTRQEPEEDGEALRALLEAGPLDDPDGVAVVVVVPGRARYHLDGCPLLGDEVGVDLEVAVARDEGFTPCGTCRPDAAIAEELGGLVAAPPEVLALPASGTFHRAGCPEARAPGADPVPADRGEALAAGYRACQECGP